MATFHFMLKSGRNGVDHSLYIMRQGFHAAREDLIAAGHGNLPTWTGGEPRKLWKAAEAGERKNGAVYREAVIALPNELDQEQNEVLAKELVEKLAPGKPYQYAIHAPSSSLEAEPNPHMHLMMSDRVDDGIERESDKFFSRYNPRTPEAGGRRKASGGRNRMELRNDVLATRKIVADTINEHLSMHGYDTRVDHRTLREQGVNRTPERRMSAVRIEKMSEREKSEHVAARKAAAQLTTHDDRVGLNP